MAKGRDKNYVSFWFWMLALFLTALPCVGVVFIIIWAIVGDNESRKNYFRAVIAWFLIMAGAWAAIMLLGLWPLMQKQIEIWIH
jgi:uncharacterized membrane protein YqjE